MIEIEIDNCIERICTFGTVTGDELVEGALDAAGVGHSLGAIKDQSTMTLIGLLAKLSKMSVRMSCIPILWEHHSNKQKMKCFKQWRALSKNSSRATHLYLFQSARSLRAMKLCAFASWKNCLRVSKRLYFMQKEKERKTTHAVFAALTGVFVLLAQAKESAASLCRSVHLKISRHYFVCWAIVAKRATLLQKQSMLKARTLKNSRFIAVSFNQWHLITARRRFVKKLYCSRNGKLKVLACKVVIIRHLRSLLQKSILSSWQCVCRDNHKLQTFSNALQGPACRKKQRIVFIAFSAFVHQKHRQANHIKVISNASNWHLKVSIFF
jgi:hypothetical protein